MRVADDVDEKASACVPVPAPDLADLAAAMLGPYSFLGTPDELEQDIIGSGAAGRFATLTLS
jgi:hypothetical protein